MKRTLLFSLLLMLLCSILPARAKDDFIQRVFTAREGLGSYNIEWMTQDADGFVWLATQDGLYRVSNNVIRRIDRQDGQLLLDDQFFLYINEVGRHKFLISAQYSAYLYDELRNQFTKLGAPGLFPQFTDDSVYSSVQGPNDTWLVLSDRDNVWRLSDDASQLTQLFSLPTVNDVHWNKLLLVDGKLLASNRQQISLFDMQGQLLQTIPLDIATGESFKLFLDSKQRLWAANRSGFYQVDLAHGQLNKIEQLPYHCRDMVDDGDGNLWIVANSGLVKYFPETGEVQNYKSQFNQATEIESVGKLMLDSNKLLWITASSQPLAIVTDRPDFVLNKIVVRNDDINAGLSAPWAYLHQQDYLWIGSDGGLVRYNMKTGNSAKVTLTSVLPNESVYVIREFDSQHLLLGTTNGLVMVNSNTLSEVSMDEWLAQDQRLRGQLIFALKQQDDRWLTASSAGFYSWKEGEHSLTRYNPVADGGKSIDTLYGFMTDTHNRLWVFGEHHFGYFVGKQYQSQRDHLSLADKSPAKVGSMLQLSEDKYWLGSRETGLLEYDLKQQKSVNLTDVWQVDCHAVFFLTQNDDFRLVGCGDKIIRQSKQTGEVIVLDKSDGLIAKELNEGAAMLAPELGLFVGTPEGTMLLDVAKMHKRVPKQSTILESVAIYYDDAVQRELSPKAEMVIRPGAKLVNFQLTNFNYLQQDSFSFKYRLNKVGSVAENKYLLLENQTQINISGLAAGHYQLEVLSRNNGLWDTQPLQFPFTVNLYLWETTWFKFVLLAGLLLGLVSIIIYRNKQISRFQVVNSALTNSDERLRQALRGSASDLWEWHREDDSLYLQNHGNVLLTELPELAMTVAELPLHPDDREQVQEQWYRMLKGELPLFDSEYRYRTALGDWRWLKVRGRPVAFDKDSGVVTKVAGIYSDITETRVLENEVTLLARAFENTSEGVLILDANECIEVTNQAAESLLEMNSQEVIGRPISDVISRADGTKTCLLELLNGGDTWTGEREIYTYAHHYLPVWLNASTIRNDRQQLQYIVLVFSDISERKQSEAELRQLANFDVLTGLPNRSLFSDRLEQAIMRAEDQQRKLAIMFLDLDRFKQVNDYYGHSMGDALLVEASNRLQSVLHKDEVLCRFGGDEFVVLVHTGDIDKINRICEAMLEKIASPFKLFGREFFISTSIGISVWPDDTRQPEILIKNADQAMYHAKDEGRGNFQYYSRERNAEALYHLRLEGDLRKAIEQNEFELHYQGQFDLLQDDRMTGVEALLRWQHPKDGFVRPDIFIKVAESCGLIIDIDRWVLRQACIDGAQWSAKAEGDFRMSVNISAVHFRQHDFIETVSQILQETGMPADHLTLEITEGVLMKELHVAREHLQQLRDMGVEVAIDDFGTGYSSLAYLRHFEVNTLKIDRSFLIDIAINSADQAIVSSIIEIARNLKLKVVAEGVESREQLEQVFSRGCYVIQGYYFCKPMPKAVLIDWLAKRAQSVN
ncbi:EAL domain-containing protein [Shewanella avicenniae]|uniref:EAL domain-containing protein n=1 Tax=Shewanella avicenniae TaxID=2814294 RepID=A0ABX7QT28_9GAMM|nr:EAL domain-containing protein [Shewanella avicenniae]QSX34018.1 EAL domain-containing protein [Shewanella avicenniae]